MRNPLNHPRWELTQAVLSAIAFPDCWQCAFNIDSVRHGVKWDGKNWVPYGIPSVWDR